MQIAVFLFIALWLATLDEEGALKGKAQAFRLAPYALAFAATGSLWTSVPRILGFGISRLRRRAGARPPPVTARRRTRTGPAIADKTRRQIALPGRE